MRTVYQPTFLPFYKIIVRLCEDANKARSNCDIIGCNLSKKHKLTLYKTLNGEPNYVDQKLEDRHPNTIELASCLVHESCDFKAT